MVRKKFRFELYVNAAKTRLTINLNGGVNRVLPIQHESFPTELACMKQEIDAIKGWARVSVANEAFLDLETYNEWRGQNENTHSDLH